MIKTVLSLLYVMHEGFCVSNPPTDRLQRNKKIENKNENGYEKKI